MSALAILRQSRTILGETRVSVAAQVADYGRDEEHESCLSSALHVELPECLLQTGGDPPVRVAESGQMRRSAAASNPLDKDGVP